ncbi:MAG: hypothetical protein MI867_23535 [Pseudomonadales bacterium]|nr:hypothetical protein [Pseudomonadales bacterium]
MEIELNEKEYDKRQFKLVEYIVMSIYESLTNEIKDEDARAEKAEEIAFSICAMIDSSAVMDDEGIPLLPHLCFRKDDEGQLLYADEGGSWMHEYVMGSTDELIGSE